ncbi:TSUP family transporter [Corynebacterium sp.]|uniref:TSUP family transporter n=1 Tax=Corynebacterium sp. TaxID=1720 RepID=UPI0026DDA83A|nr:TSUP family transporter [Corynebacterium sp.]MDO5077674.1 TSUP family transporter [Corynebacterium sp.]
MEWVFVGALAAGWIDAVIGGGGLILIPLLMSVGLSPTLALGTNKLAGCLGTTSAAAVMIRNMGAPPALFRLIPVAVVASGCGALLASSLSAAVMRPLVIALLLAAGVFVAVRPGFGGGEGDKGTSHPGVVIAVVALIAGYDGFFGPGTGMFLIIAFTALVTGDFLRSSVYAKTVNVCTNLGALIVFGFTGQVWWQLGLGLACATVVGAQIGARTVLRGGAKFVRYALLAMVIVMVTRLIIVG